MLTSIKTNTFSLSTQSLSNTRPSLHWNQFRFDLSIPPKKSGHDAQIMWIDGIWLVLVEHHEYAHGGREQEHVAVRYIARISPLDHATPKGFQSTGETIEAEFWVWKFCINQSRFRFLWGPVKIKLDSLIFETYAGNIDTEVNTYPASFLVLRSKPLTPQQLQQEHKSSGPHDSRQGE